jgi:hypothetical protein
MAFDPFLPPTFTAQGDDAGVYYAAQRDSTSTLWWYGEDRDARWAHVFRGQLTLEGADARWNGVFIDVPKGVTCGHGRLGWERGFTGGAPFLRRTAVEGGFGGMLIAPGPFPPAPVRRLMPGFTGEGLENLTGVWLGNDGGTYYVREVGETGQVAWVGEHPEADPGTEVMPGRRWVNVFMGQRTDRLIRGEWSDVPKGEVDQHGTMTLFATAPDRLTVIRKTGGFGGLRFVRVENLEITLRWVSLRVLDQQEWFFEGDEPYFLALIALMDGRTVNLTAPEGSRADFSHSFVAPMLQSNVGAGAVIDLSSLPPLELGIRRVPGDRPDIPHPVLAIALRGAEKDESSPAWQEDRLQDWIDTGGGAVDRALQRTGMAGFETNVARWHETFTWRNEDDLFGLDSNAFTYAQLESMSGRTTRLTFDLRGGDVRYSVTADLSVRGVRGTCSP